VMLIGVILGGHLFRGTNGFAGEIGHMIDAERLSDVGWPIEVYLSRADQDARLAALLRDRPRVATPAR